MKISSTSKSLSLFVISIVFLVLLTLFEDALSGLPVTAERMISGLLLVLPGLLGVIFGVLGLIRREGRPWLAVLGILLNLLFALFHMSVLSFAG